MNQKVRNVLIMTVGMMLLLSSAYHSEAGQKQKLPRTFGTIYLGMSVEAFKKLTHLEPTQCVHCVEGEMFTVFFVESMTEGTFYFKELIMLKEGYEYQKRPFRLKNTYLTHQPITLQPERIECYFYGGKLYGIIFNEVAGAIDAVKNKYIKIFGQPTSITNFGTGISEVVWENSASYLIINYSTGRKSIDMLTIKYTDKDVAAHVPPREMSDE